MPYEFALKMMNGIAFHRNNSSRYIPIYLKPYRDSVALFPNFVAASQHIGYQMPHDINKLLQFLVSTDEEYCTDSQQIKNQFFMHRMETLSKKLMQLPHQDCNREYCRSVSILTILYIA